jgi:tetratricopeptide (TPR) repeat protein
VQEELSEKSALTAISGIAAHAFENESRSWSAKERSVLAMGYADLKDDEEALDLYRVALAVIPNDGATLVGYGEALKRVGQIEEAIEVFRKALPTERHVEALTGLASCYLTLKRYDEFYLLGPRLLAHKYEGHNAGLIVLLDYARLAPDVERGKELLRKIIQEVPDEYLVHDFLLCGKAYGGSLRFGWNWTADLLAKDMGYFEWSMPGSYARARARRIAQVCEATAKRRFAEKVAATEAIFAVAKGPIVRGIEVRSENPYMTITPRAVLANMEVKIGKPYVESMVEADVRNLYATGAIANLRIFGQQLPNGVKIIVVIQEGLTP